MFERFNSASREHNVRYASLVCGDILLMRNKSQAKVRSAIWQRIKRMREKGIIEVYSVDWDADPIAVRLDERKAEEADYAYRLNREMRKRMDEAVNDV